MDWNNFFPYFQEKEMKESRASPDMIPELLEMSMSYYR